MKPPPRKRTKPDRSVKPESVPSRSGKRVCEWRLAEQKKLLNSLKRLRKTANVAEELDYAFLTKDVPTRSISEVQSVVESLQTKVISCASFELKKNRWEEKRVRKPIEVWTYMASAVAGTLEDPISSAFSQMLTVSSVEPRTLMNCDPPQLHSALADKDKTVGRTVPLRPMPHLPVQGERPGTNTAHSLQVLKNPTPSGSVITVPNGKIPPPQQSPPNTAGISSATTPCRPHSEKALVPSPQPASQALTPVTGQVTPSCSPAAVVRSRSVGRAVIQTNQQSPEQHPASISSTLSSKSTSSSPCTPVSSSAASRTPGPRTASSPVASSSSATAGCFSSQSTPQLFTSAAAFHARFGRTSKYATKDSPRAFGVNGVVDFERIYRYLSAIHKPNEECHLTPMESAIVLDLLMSLPEELPLLDCNKLHKHLIQVYKCLSSPADSKMAREMLKDLHEGLCAQTEASSSRDSNRTNGQQNEAGTADNSDVTDSRGKEVQPDEVESQSSKHNNTSNQSGDSDTMGCLPPLNPFMVPLKLLMHR